jgi:hypothetical protein
MGCDLAGNLRVVSPVRFWQLVSEPDWQSWPVHTRGPGCAREPVRQTGHEWCGLLDSWTRVRLWACPSGQSGRVKETPMCDGGDCWNSLILVVGEGWTNLKVEKSFTSKASFWGAVRISSSWTNASRYRLWSCRQLAGCLSGEILTSVPRCS